VPSSSVAIVVIINIVVVFRSSPFVIGRLVCMIDRQMSADASRLDEVLNRLDKTQAQIDTVLRLLGHRLK
jgi:hypothetical protein